MVETESAISRPELQLQTMIPQASDGEEEDWYASIQYLSNISVLGAVCCVAFFFIVKLRSDHRLPGPASLAAKLLSVWHTTGVQIASVCGANSAQYLTVEGYTCIAFLMLSLPSLLAILPLHLYSGKVQIRDQFAKATIVHIEEGSPILWVHVIFMCFVTALMHICVNVLEGRLQSTIFHNGVGVNADSLSIFTLMIRGVPRVLAMDKRPLEDYFENKYPGKIYRIIVPADLNTFASLQTMLVRTRDKLAWARARVRAQNRVHFEDNHYYFIPEESSAYVDLASSTSGVTGLHGMGIGSRCAWLGVLSKKLRKQFIMLCHCTDEDKIRRLEVRCKELEARVAAYREGRAQGAGIAFVVFKDVFTANRALQDAKVQSKCQRTGLSMVEMQLAMGRWQVERAPAAQDIYWHHLGRSTLGRRLRTVAVNVLLLLLLTFCSSPLAAITAMHNASRAINEEAVDHIQLWLAWVRASNWVSTFMFQFLPNVLIFFSMYVIIPAALVYLSRFESHITVSGEQQAVLVKTVCFFLVNLIILKALVETTLEAALLHFGSCYIESIHCKSIKHLMSINFLTNSCLSALAFLITSSLLGISFDLLAPIPWIKRKFWLFKSRNLTGFPGQDFLASATQDARLHDVLLPGYGSSEEDILPSHIGSANGIDLQGQDLSVYPLAKGLEQGVQPFDFAQYYAFNLTIFALTIVYCTFAPIVSPFGALYFGYRYAVDKYNFLFVYRIRGLPAANDGKLMTTVLWLMRVCICLYLMAMLLFFYARGDNTKLQFLATLVLLIFSFAKYGFEKLISTPKDNFALSMFQNIGALDEVLEGSEVGYEVLARPNFDFVPQM